MTKKEALQLFEEKKIRSVWDDKEEKWYFSIVDVCAVLTESKDPAAYWRKLKQRLKQEGNETVTNCHGLKLRAADGKLLSARVIHENESGPTPTKPTPPRFICALHVPEPKLTDT